MVTIKHKAKHYDCELVWTLPSHNHLFDMGIFSSDGKLYRVFKDGNKYIAIESYRLLNK